MFVELHLIQNFAPSCLNRDDTNSPKDCEFGGYRRARVSSQCIKRAIRWDGTFQAELKDHLSSRSLRFPQQVVELLAQMGVDQKSATVIGKSLQDIAKKEREAQEKEEKPASQDVVFKTPQMVFYTAEEVKSCAEAIKNLLDQKVKPGEVMKEGRKRKDFVFPTPRSADIALFGRMVTSDSFVNVDAACQVAHAISTNKVVMDLDYYTAVDDLQPQEEAGAGMIGVTGFNSSCFYRYSVVDLDQLNENLGGDEDLACKTLEAFLRASVSAIPTGKQASMAAHNPPDAVLAVVRGGGAPVSLANAFATPIRPSNQKSLVQASIEAMDGYWGKLARVYGEMGVKARPICAVDDVELSALKTLGGKSQVVQCFDDLVKVTMKSVSFREGK